MQGRDGDADPICISRGELPNLKRLISRSINPNQESIIRFLWRKNCSISQSLREISKSDGTPLSTLKMNAKVLKEISLIEFERGSEAKLTNLGKIVADILEVV